MRPLYALAIAAFALLAAVCARASFMLISGPDLSAPAGGTLSWSLEIENSDTSRYLRIDDVQWTALLDVLQGSSDDFSLFNFPVVAPQSGGDPTVDIESLLSVTWLETATRGYAIAGEFIISSSFCDGDSGDGCESNPGIHLVSSAAVATDLTSTPEPAGLAFAAVLLLIASCARRRAA